MKTVDLIRALESGEIKEFPGVTFPGAYPLFYVDSRCNVHCAKCATAKKEDITDYDIYYEGGGLECIECGTTIESAYGEPEDEE